LLFDAGLAGLIGIGEQKYAMAVTTAEPVMAFRVLPMTVKLSRLTTGTMNINAGHAKIAKAGIIHQFN